MGLKLPAGPLPLLGLFGLILGLGVAAFMSVEHLSLLDALYFTVVTVATVGYGDIHPQSDLGKILAMGFIVTGVGGFTAAVAGGADALLSRHERLGRLSRLNMVIGAFFSEAGDELLRRFSSLDPRLEDIRDDLSGAAGWGAGRLAAIRQRMKSHDFQTTADGQALADMAVFLREKTPFLLRLLENPNLGEHELFTELLWAVFHLKDELVRRQDFSTLAGPDLTHLRGDVRRAYGLIVSQWVEYMAHLRADYPYLYSLAARTNPFDRDASPEVRS